MINDGIVVVRGGGDIATGTICRLHHCGYKILILPIKRYLPTHYLLIAKPLILLIALKTLANLYIPNPIPGK